MEKSERPSLDDMQVLEDKRRKAAARVRRLLEELEAAEREFNAATREVRENAPPGAAVLYRRHG
jgi:hypothetical protein